MFGFLSGSGEGQSRRRHRRHHRAHDELLRHARAQGRINLPKTDESSPNEEEAAVAARAHVGHSALADECSAAVRREAAQFASVRDRLARPAELRARVEQAMARVEAYVAQDQSVRALHREVLERQRDLDALLDRYRIDREARYPHSHLRHFGVVASVGAAELLPNSVFFAAGSEHGLAGGSVAALVVTVCNMALGIAIGYFAVRALVVSAGLQRALVGIGGLGATLAAVEFNFVTAHYRDLAAIGDTVPGAAVRAAVHDPFGLSYASLALFVLGLLTFGFAVWEGYRSDDPIPAYGACHRRLVAARDSFRAALDDLLGRMLGELEELRVDCASAVDHSSDGVEELGKVLVRVRGHYAGYDRGRADLETGYMMELRAYRVANRRVRSTRPPRYFDSFEPLPVLLDVAILRELLDEYLVAKHQHEALKGERDQIENESPGRVAFVKMRFAAHVREQVLDGSVPLVTNFSEAVDLALLGPREVRS